MQSRQARTEKQTETAKGKHTVDPSNALGMAAAKGLNHPRPAARQREQQEADAVKKHDKSVPGLIG